jgi:hypothetical protein
MIASLLLVALTQGYALKAGVTPVQKVIQLLQEMSAKGAAEKAAEAQTFAQYSEFCHNMTRDKNYAIEKAAEQIEMLLADIQKAESDSAVAARKIAKFDAQIADLDAEKAEANAESEKAREDYLKEHADYSESVDSLARGIQQLQSGSIPSLVQGGRNSTSFVQGGHNSTESKEAMRKRKEALMQVQRLAKLPVHAKRVLTAFLDSRQPEEEAPDTRGAVERSTDDELDRMFETPLAGSGGGTYEEQKFKEDALATTAPEQEAYGFQSGGVVMMLKKLLFKFKDEVHECEQEELKRKAHHASVIMDLENQIAVATESRDAEQAIKSERDQTAAEKKNLLNDTERAKADDEKYLATLTSECEMAASDFESRQQLRTEELGAIGKAIEILSGGSVSGAADKHLPSLLQSGPCTTKLCLQSLAFPFLRSGPSPKGQKSTGKATGKTPDTKSISKFLKVKAEKTHSKLLSLVAEKVGAIMPNIPGVTPLDLGEDPIGAVKKMMKDMILQLMDQANEEASQRGWCTTELGTNKQTREEKTDGVEKLTSQKDRLTADIAKLGEEIADLMNAIAGIDSAVAEATETRNEEKATNTETIADAKEAQTAVGNALTVLKEFYQKAATATALVQATSVGDDDDAAALVQEEPQANPFAENSYKGMGGESTGVVGMLEVIASDFARLESETEMAEDQASKEFTRFSYMSAEDKAVKNQEMQDRTNLQVNKKSALKNTENDLKAMQGQLDTALAYYDKLKPACIYTGEKYEERVARRQAEIEGLEDALKFFEGQDLPPML